MSESSATARIEGLRILAVDVEPDLLETIVDVLAGATDDGAASYEEAMERLTASESNTPASEARRESDTASFRGGPP